MTFGHANGVLLSENMGTPSGYVDWGNMTKEQIAAKMARVAIEATTMRSSDGSLFMGAQFYGEEPEQRGKAHSFLA